MKVPKDKKSKTRKHKGLKKMKADTEKKVELVEARCRFLESASLRIALLLVFLMTLLWILVKMASAHLSLMPHFGQ